MIEEFLDMWISVKAVDFARIVAHVQKTLNHMYVLNNGYIVCAE